MSESTGSSAEINSSDQVGAKIGSKPGVSAISGNRKWYLLLPLPY